MAFTTSNMGLTIPQINDPSPGYTSNVTSSLQAVDAHDHSTGKGVQVTPAGLNVNAALPLNGNALTAARNTQYANQGAVLNTLADAQSTFVYGGNLYYSSATGQPVQITNGANLATLVGAIGGDYATYGALLNYLHSSKQYNFYDETGTLAPINTGGVGVTGNITASGTANVTGTVTGGNLMTAGTLTAPTINATGTSTLGTANVTTLTATNVTSSGTQNLTGTTNIASAQLGTSGVVNGGTGSSVTANTVTGGTGGLNTTATTTSGAWVYTPANPGFWYFAQANQGYIAGGTSYADVLGGPGGSSTIVLHASMYNGTFYLPVRLPRSFVINASCIALMYYRGVMSTAATAQIQGSNFAATYTAGSGITNATPSAYSGSLPASVSLGTTASADSSWLYTPLNASQNLIYNYPGVSAASVNDVSFYVTVTNSNSAGTAALHIAGVAVYLTLPGPDSCASNVL